MTKTALFLLFCFCTAARPAGEPTRQEFQDRFHLAREKEAQALPRIAELKTRIAAVQSDIEQTGKDRMAVWNEILAVLGADQAKYEAFIGSLNSLETRINGIALEFSSDRAGWNKALKSSETRRDSLKHEPLAALSRVEEYFEGIESALQSSRNALALPIPAAAIISSDKTGTNQIIVGSGDSLWRIARRQDIFGNPLRWMEIYTANQNKIKNPDLIFPGQVLAIPK